MRIQDNPKISLGKHIFATYVFFLFSVALMARFLNWSGPFWLDRTEFTRLLRCFAFIELFVRDPREVLVGHLPLAHFYLSYAVYLVLKFNSRLRNTLSERNLSPFLLAFGATMTIIVLPVMSVFFLQSSGFNDIFIFCLMGGGYNAIALFLQYIAFKTKSRKFLRMSIVFMLILNVAGFLFCVCLAIFFMDFVLYGP